MLRPYKEEGRIDKKTYKVNKPDIEHIEKDDINTEDLTSDSEDEATKEENFHNFMTLKSDTFGGIVKKFEFPVKGYGEKGEIDKFKVNKEDKQQKKFDSKIGDLLSKFKGMREEKFGKKEEVPIAKSK